jgi:DNA-binding NarL/FixJ family response regulator
VYIVENRIYIHNMDKIVENLSNAEIAQKLFISEATVKTHVSSILRKTGQPNRSQAVLYALKNGYVKVPS